MIAKFRVKENVPDPHNAGLFNIWLEAVYDPDPESENGKFFRYTPGGTIRLPTTNPAAAEQFVPGEEVYVTFLKER